MPQTLTTAQRIRIARSEAGITQKALAELTGIAQPNLSRYEAGSSKPTAGTVDTIMEALAALTGNRSLNAIDGVLGIRGRSAGKLELVDLTQEPEPISWVVAGFLARGYTTVVAGESGAGKSNLSQTLGAALANGAEYACGMTLPGTPQRGLFIDAENGKNLILDRAKNMLGLQESAHANYHVAEARGFDLRYDSDIVVGILEDAQTCGAPYDFMVIDSMMTTWFGSVMNADQVREYMQRMNEIAARFNIGLLIIHHTGKGGEFYGSFAIEANVSGALFEFIKRGGDESMERELHASKMRLAAAPAPIRLFVTNHGISHAPEGE